MNELQQVLLVFAVVVIAGLYFLSRSRHNNVKKEVTSSPQPEVTATKPHYIHDTLKENTLTSVDVIVDTHSQASKALNELGHADIPVSIMTHERLTKLNDLAPETEFNYKQTTLSFGEEFDLPAPTSISNTEKTTGTLAIDPQQEIHTELNAEKSVQSEIQHHVDPEITVLGTNEKGGTHHLLVVEDPGMNFVNNVHVTPEHVKPTFGVPEAEVGKSPGVTSGEKKNHEVFVILVMSTAQEFSMARLNHALLGVGLIFSDKGFYVKQDNMGNEIIKVANLLEPGFFPKEDHETYTTPGVAMILELPSTVRAPAAMHDLIMMARKVCQRLDGRLYNMERQIMKESDLQSMRELAIAYESVPL